MEASPKLGGLRPTSLQLRMMCWPWVLRRKPRRDHQPPYCKTLIIPKTFTGDIRGDVPPVQQAPQLVAHIDYHDLLASTSKVGDLALDGLGNTRVNGATEATIRGHANDQVLSALVLWRLDLGLLIQSYVEVIQGDKSVQSHHKNS